MRVLKYPAPELLRELPEKKETVWSYSGEEDPEVTGHNEAIDQVSSILERKIGELNV